MFKAGDKVYVKRFGWADLELRTYLITFKGRHYFKSGHDLGEDECDLLSEKEGDKLKRQDMIKETKVAIEKTKRKIKEWEDELAQLTKEDE